MRSIDLSSCWAKLDWAKRHRDALDEKIVQHFMVEANRPRTIGQYDSSSGCHIYRITHVPDNLDALLLYVSLSIGDIVHNLRSTLDHLAYQLAIAEASRTGHRLTSEERERISFPIHTSRRRGRGRRPGWLDREQSYVRRFGRNNTTLIKRFQPYYGRAGRPDSFSGRYTHPLTLLRQLSNRDKHRLLNVVAAVPTVMMFSLPDGIRFSPAQARASPLRVKLGAEMPFRYVLHGVGANNVEVEGEITPSVMFPKRGQVIPAIDRIAAFVLQIVREFDPLS